MGKLLAGEQVGRAEVGYLANLGDKRSLDGNRPQRAYTSQQARAWFRAGAGREGPGRDDRAMPSQPGSLSVLH